MDDGKIDDEMFVGRRAEAHTLIANVEKRRHSLIVAEHGMGKTSLIECFLPIIEDLGRSIYAERVGPSPSTFLAELYRGLWEHGIVNRPSSDVEECLKEWGKKHKSNDAKAKAIAEIFESNDNIILVIDDISNVTKSNLHWLLDFAENVTLVAGVNPDALKVHKRFWKLFDEIRLTPMSKQESKDLLDKLIKRYRVKADDMTLYKRNVLTGAQGSPFELVNRVKYDSSDDLVKVNEMAYRQEARAERDRKEISLMPFLLLGVGCIIASRFLARARGDMDGYVIAGFVMVFSYFSLQWVRGAMKPRSR